MLLGRRTRPGRARFDRYIDAYVSDAPGLALTYPDLRSTPWHDPARFAICAALDAAFTTIRAEIEAVPPAAFAPEAERAIARDGRWDVVMLYERGRRHARACSLVPRTAEILDRFETVKTYAGLAYFSRLRAQTHVAAHRGPTNLRVRCHLPLAVPAGDCALRVGDEVRAWQAGRSLVFDDSYEHEAWNRTAADRIVLVVDLWNPDLCADEVRRLVAFQTRILAQSNNLTRYWADNERARREPQGDA
jgi:aspartate beta-hydroxylase